VPRHPSLANGKVPPLALTAVLSYSSRQPQDTPPGIPPVVRAEAARIPWVPPLASELVRLLMADAIGPANISHNMASE
jgi:hypothetical protein